MVLFVSVLLMLLLPTSHLINIDISDIDIYGPMLVVKEHLAISIFSRYGGFALYRPYNSSEFCAFYINLGIYVMNLGIGDNGTLTSNIFYYQGAYLNYTQQLAYVRVSFSMSPCSYSTNTIIIGPPPAGDYTVWGVRTTRDTTIYLDDDITRLQDYQLWISSNTGGRPGSVNPNFIYYTIDINYDDWGVLAGAIPISGVYVPTLYLINFPPNITGFGYNYGVLNTWTAPFTYSWQSRQARPYSGSNYFDPSYSMSLSINNVGDILFGVQSMNTVFHLYVNPANPTSFIFKSSRIYSMTIASIGFGKSVGWLDDTTAVILANNVSLDYSQWYSSNIEIYDLSGGQQLSNTQDPYSSFPTNTQPIYSTFTTNIIFMAATYAGSIIFADSSGNVYIILPSPSGYYSATNVGNNLGINVYSSIPSICPAGTSIQGLAYGKYIFDTCITCPEGTYSQGSANLTAGCLPCDATEYFCPFGAVAEVPLSYLATVSQAVSFPKSPDLTEFSDILLLNMFNTNFEANCLVTTPFFWTLIMAGVGFIFLITMGILKLTGKCEHYRTKIESILRHFDIISEGERWMGGVLSFTIILIIIFAALFTNSFIKQYPQATSKEPDFTCDETLRNSQFFSQMQALGAAVPDSMEEIFNLLKFQKFTLTVTLLNTIVDKNISVTQTVGTIVTKLSRDLSVPTSGCLVISCNLTAAIATININISTTDLIGGVRIGLSGPGTSDQYNQLKELNFSTSFYISNRTLSQEPYFNIELIQVINETRPLSVSDASKYSGLWIPTFIKDDDQNFYTLTTYETFHTQLYTILTVDITQAPYYIYNVEKPIIKTTAVIFKNILFATMCMEILAFAFLIVKLAIGPLFRLIIRLIYSKKEEEESKEENENEDDESEKEEEEHKSDDDEDGDEASKEVKLKPGINEWYTPDVES